MVARLGFWREGRLAIALALELVVFPAAAVFPAVAVFPAAAAVVVDGGGDGLRSAPVVFFLMGLLRLVAVGVTLVPLR